MNTDTDDGGQPSWETVARLDVPSALDDKSVRVMKENATTLKLKTAEFETEYHHERTV